MMAFIRYLIMLSNQQELQSFFFFWKIQVWLLIFFFLPQKIFKSIQSWTCHYSIAPVWNSQTNIWYRIQTEYVYWYYFFSSSSCKRLRWQVQLWMISGLIDWITVPNQWISPENSSIWKFFFSFLKPIDEWSDGDY